MNTRPADVSNILLDRVSSWLKTAALGGESLEYIIAGFCERLAAAGLPLVRVHLSFSMLHPLYDALGFTWMRGQGVTVEGFRADGENSEPSRFLLEIPEEQLHLVNARRPEPVVAAAPAAAADRAATPRRR